MTLLKKTLKTFSNPTGTTSLPFVADFNTQRRFQSLRPAFLAAGAVLSVIGLTNQASADDLDQMMAAQTQFKATMSVACGNMQKSNCNQVLPRIADKAAPLGLSFKPITSRGSVQSANAVCKGIVNAAVGQQDAFDQVRRQTECAGTFDVVAKPLYPYFGYLVVANSNPASSLQQLVDNVPEGKSLSVADGKVGSGGQVTFSQILSTNPAYKEVINPVDNDQDTALGKILDGTLDAYFVMDGPGSSLVEQIKNQTDSKGNRLYKFVEVLPNDAFFALKDWNGKGLYSIQTIPGGWFGRSTVSTNAVVIVNTPYANTDVGGKALTALRNAADQAEAPIRADTHTPHAWTGENPAP